MNEPNNEEDNFDWIGFSKAMGPLIEKFNSFIETQGKVNEPIIKRAQWMNFIIMLIVTLAVVGLSYIGKIDGSAATGLLGAIIGYVFGHIYSNREK